MERLTSEMTQKLDMMEAEGEKLKESRKELEDMQQRLKLQEQELAAQKEHAKMEQQRHALQSARDEFEQHALRNKIEAEKLSSLIASAREEREKLDSIRIRDGSMMTSTPQASQVSCIVFYQPCTDIRYFRRDSRSPYGNDWMWTTAPMSATGRSA